MKRDLEGEIKFSVPEETMNDLEKVHEKVNQLYLSVASLYHQIELLEAKIPMVVYRINELKSTIK